MQSKSLYDHWARNLTTRVHPWVNVIDTNLKLPSPSIAFILTKGLAVFGTAWLVLAKKTELIPQLWISLIVALLSYWACWFTSERLRLDLFDKRFEIYAKVIEFCSAVATNGSLEVRAGNEESIASAMTAAEQSFRGIGYHKARALIDSDINNLLGELNNHFAYIIAFGRQENRNELHNTEEYFQKITRVVDIVKELPDHFQPYLYFGDHKMARAATKKLE